MPFTEVNGKRIFYSWKPASRAGLTIFFIHGLGGAHSFWSPVIPGLVDAGFSCLAFDVPGFGQSPYHGKSQDLHEIADDAVVLLESLGKSLDRTIIVGASMAGIVCCEIAIKHQIAGIVSVGPICPGPETKEAFDHRVAVVKKDGLEGIVNSVDIPTRATGSKATRTAEAFVRSLIQSSNADAYASLAQAIADAPVPEYQKITCPLLCVAGQEDQVARLEDLATIGDRHVPSFAFPLCVHHSTKSTCCSSSLTCMQPTDSNFCPAGGERHPRRNSKSFSEWVTGTASRMQMGWRLASRGLRKRSRL